MTDLVFFLAVFLGLGVFFLLIHLLMGKVIRPARPAAEKLTIYECGEPTIGSAWIQFDLRYYVVALLFVIFDVEVAFFFPWAVVFGKANTLADPDLVAEKRQEVSNALVPNLPPTVPATEANPRPADQTIDAATGQRLGWIAFVDILIFFGVLLVGFAYLWRRGDIDWVRSTSAERLPPTSPERVEQAEQLVASGPAM
jgi:NADH-quinone oxidoreductase subunit A